MALAGKHCFTVGKPWRKYVQQEGWSDEKCKLSFKSSIHQIHLAMICEGKGCDLRIELLQENCPLRVHTFQRMDEQSAFLSNFSYCFAL